MKYSIKVQPKVFRPNKAFLKLKMLSEIEDCKFLNTVITFALGNPIKLQAFINYTLKQGFDEDTEDQEKHFGFP